MDEFDEIDRALLTNEQISIHPRLVANVMAEIITTPAPHTFRWQPFAVKAASYGSIAVAAAVTFSRIDMATLAPAVVELTIAAATLVAAFVAIYFPRLSSDVSD